MLSKTRQLIDELNAIGVTYCHWKSNLALAESLAGETDVDLLVRRGDQSAFRATLHRLSFRPAETTDGRPFPAVEHYHALDEETGCLVHVHVYYRVITGESLTKNYRFPLEDMLLENLRVVDSVPLPAKSAELAVFTLRMMLKHTSLAELALLARYWKQVPRELEWLLDTNSIDETLRLLERWLPPVDASLFSACVAALKGPAPLTRRILLGRRLRSQLRPYARHSRVRVWIRGLLKFSIMFARRLTGSRKGMIPRSGGAVLAFVGSEATGKSTLLAEMSRWLGKHFAVRRIHVGKPPSTWVSRGPNLLLPALRSLLPAHRSTHVESRYASGDESKTPGADYSLLFAVRSVLLAHDRRSLLTRAFRRAANGTIVLCDRYPSSRSGALDSPQLSHLPVPEGRYSLRRVLARMEARMYAQIPSPDLVIYLRAPLEVTMARNAARGKREPEDYVRWRHARSADLEFRGTPVTGVDTDQPFGETILEVKRAVWSAL